MRDSVYTIPTSSTIMVDKKSVSERDFVTDIRKQLELIIEGDNKIETINDTLFRRRKVLPKKYKEMVRKKYTQTSYIEEIKNYSGTLIFK